MKLTDRRRPEEMMAIMRESISPEEL